MTPGTLTRRLCATTLIAQALSVFLGALVAWRLGQTTGDPRAGAFLWGGLALAALCLVAAGALRGRRGILLGWVAQFLTLAAGIVLPAMFVVAGLFGFLWWLCLTQGVRMDRLTAQRAEQERQHEQEQGGS
ncbi:DUF4233 domain-containing protein [uncultured Serinicoccus sp.]|uniref:DUF4233 domain-containing protein n=1 Tax=uncultured Serinicoccus sp. TaxID=735514 RepID=UPI00260FAC39|nr:DUF4233 domain-containing protein [uncultured Serinicoccus sp.]